jgi:hypothetical protein
MRFAFAGGQDEHPWLVNSSTTVGTRFAASADTENPAARDIATPPVIIAFDNIIGSLLG